MTTDAVVAPTVAGRGRWVSRGAAVLAGTEPATRVFEIVDPRIEVRFERQDGAVLAPGEVFGQVQGAAASLLKAERTALNLLQRSSGIATLTARFVAAVAGTAAQIVDTRKTAPGSRHLDKDAVRSGGGRNHRASLSDGVLIKTNHVRLAGGVEAAVRRARAAAAHTLRIEVEVRDVEELEAAIAAGADLALLDNMDLSGLRAAVAAAAGRVGLEASGGVTLENVREVALTGVQFISVGRLTHSAPAADLALEIEGCEARE